MKTSRKRPCTLLRILKRPSNTLVDMQTAQDTSVSTFLVTDVRNASVSVRILLEWEISRKCSGKPHFTAVVGVTIQSRTLWWISILFRTPWQPHSESGGTQFLQKMSASTLQGMGNHARNPPPTPPHPPHLFGRIIQRLLGQPSQMNNWHSSKNRLLQNGSLIHVTVRYFINGRLGTSDNPLSFQLSSEQSNIRRSLLRAALTPPAHQSNVFFYPPKSKYCCTR